MSYSQLNGLFSVCTSKIDYCSACRPNRQNLVTHLQQAKEVLLQAAVLSESTENRGSENDGRTVFKYSKITSMKQ